VLSDLWKTKKWDSAGKRFWEISPLRGGSNLSHQIHMSKKEKGDFGIDYSLGTVTPRLPKSLYFNLFSIAKRHQFDGIHSTIKRYYRTRRNDVQTLCQLWYGVRFGSRFKFSVLDGSWNLIEILF
jgi:hypothetical protein